MALNIPMPDLPGTSFLKGVDTGSSMFSRMIQPVIERERLKQQQDQFVQNLALQKQQEQRQQSLMPYLIQQYVDAHRTAASEAQFKELYRNLIRNAVGDDTGATGGATPSPTAAPTATPGTIPMPGTNPVAPPMPPQIAAQVAQAAQAAQGAQPVQTPPPIAGSNAAPNVVPNAMSAGAPNPVAAPVVSTPDMSGQEQVIRAGNPRLAKLDQIAGLVPGIPKPVQHISNGMVFTSYPSGRMTVQKVTGSAGQTPAERGVSAKEASKIRDQATALINSANLVQQGYELLDNNDDLTGIGAGLASKFNLSNNPDLGKFTTVTGKLQAELGKYASSRGGIQAVNWAGNVKPSQWKPEDYNYGMFEGIQRNLADDYKTLNAQYKAATGQDLPVPLPQMTSKKQRPGSSGAGSSSGGTKVTKKWKLVNGELV